MHILICVIWMSVGLCMVPVRMLYVEAKVDLCVFFNPFNLSYRGKLSHLNSELADAANLFPCFLWEPTNCLLATEITSRQAATYSCG